jgi:hypothetical protein
MLPRRGVPGKALANVAPGILSERNHANAAGSIRNLYFPIEVMAIRRFAHRPAWQLL